MLVLSPLHALFLTSALFCKDAQSCCYFFPGMLINSRGSTSLLIADSDSAFVPRKSFSLLSAFTVPFFCFLFLSSSFGSLPPSPLFSCLSLKYLKVSFISSLSPTKIPFSCLHSDVCLPFSFCSQLTSHEDVKSENQIFEIF